MWIIEAFHLSDDSLAYEIPLPGATDQDIRNVVTIWGPDQWENEIRWYSYDIPDRAALQTLTQFADSFTFDDTVIYQIAWEPPGQ